MSPNGTTATGNVDLDRLDQELALVQIIEHAVTANASDLFLVSNETGVDVLMRTMGTMQRIGSLSRDRGRQTIMQVKVSAAMDAADHRRPLDGRWMVEVGDVQIDLRVNSIPTLHGEDLCIRLLDRRVGLLTVDELGFERFELNEVKQLLTSPGGLILVTGPTGCGKTTTLYAFLQYLNTGTRKINTIEDPVEFSLAGIRQTQVNTRLGLDFPELLKGVIRQAPDVIMIGEIRDATTAATAVRAANSGHLVLATLHSRYACAAIDSMLGLGVHPYFLSDCLLAVVAQRLVRVLCQHCRESFDLSLAPRTFEEVRRYLKPDEGHRMFTAPGCDRCHHLGYSGRSGIFEVLTCTPEIRRMIAENTTVAKIQELALRGGMIDFRRSALIRVARGLTNMEEVLRVVPVEMGDELLD